MRVLGIIPARGGSKGVPGKNIKEVNGKPLLFYTIKAAKESKLLTNFVVATDDEKIVSVAEKFDSPVYKRDTLNAQDNSPIEFLIAEVINSLKEKYDVIMLLQPTAPIRTGKDIDAVITMFLNDVSITNVVSVIALSDIHPARMYLSNNQNKLMPYEKEQEKFRRQDLNTVFLRNGSIYAITTNKFLEFKTIITQNKNAYVMPESHWVNIDTHRDFLIAEVLIKEWEAGRL